MAFGTWAAPDGWPHRRMEWAQPEGRPPRGSLLFIGGRGDFVEKYLEALAYWHDRGWSLTAFDWRGQGGSRGDIPRGHLDDFDILVDDLAALIAEWSAEAPGPHVAVAHSLGAHVLLRALAERKPALDAAVLVAPMISINSGLLPPWCASLLASTLATLGWSREPAWRAPPPGPGSPRQKILTNSAERFADEAWWWERQPGFGLGAPTWGWFDAAYRSTARTTDERLAEIEVPVLILGAVGDRLVGQAAIDRAAASIPGAELEMVADTGHEILRERDEVRLSAHARIDRFFDEKAPG